MTDEKCERCKAAEQINKDWIRFFSKNKSLATFFFKCLGVATIVSSIGFSAYMIYYLIK